MFWPGSETVIGGRQATFWKPFDDDLPHTERVDQVLEWLKLPEGKRPSFLTLYFSEVDNAGHADGPESEAVKRCGEKRRPLARRAGRRRERRSVSPIACTTSWSAITAWRRSAPIA